MIGQMITRPGDPANILLNHPRSNTAKPADWEIVNLYPVESFGRGSPPG